MATDNEWREITEFFKKIRAGKEAERAVYAANKLTDMGFVVTWDSSHKCLEFRYKDARVRFYPYKGWFTGKTVKDGRGLQNLIKQLQV